MSASQSKVYRGPNESEQLHTLSQVEIEQLTRTLYFSRPSDTQDAHDRWLAFQKRSINTLEAPLVRSWAFLHQFATRVGRNGFAFTAESAQLCSTHKELNGKLIRSLTMLIAEECIDRVECFRHWDRKGKLDAITHRWLTGIDDITVLGAGRTKAAKIIRYDSPYRPPVLVDTDCEACKLAVLGGSTYMLRDLRVAIIAHQQYLRDIGSADNRSPLLLAFVNSWISTCYTGTMRRALTAESDELVPAILSLRHHRRLDRQQRTEHRQRQRQGKSEAHDNGAFAHYHQQGRRAPTPPTSWEKAPRAYREPATRNQNRVSRKEAETAEHSQHHRSFNKRPLGPRDIAYLQARGPGPNFEAHIRQFENSAKHFDSDSDSDGYEDIISDIPAIMGRRYKKGPEGLAAYKADLLKYGDGTRRDSRELRASEVNVGPASESGQPEQPEQQPNVFDYLVEEPDTPPMSPRSGSVQQSSEMQPGRLLAHEYQDSPSAYTSIRPASTASGQSREVTPYRPTEPEEDTASSSANPHCSVFDYQVEYFSDEEPPKARCPAPQSGYQTSGSSYSADRQAKPVYHSYDEGPDVLSPTPIHPPSRTEALRHGSRQYSNSRDSDGILYAAPPALAPSPVAPLARSNAIRRSIGSERGNEQPVVQQALVQRHDVNEGYTSGASLDVQSMCAAIDEVASCYSTMGWGGPRSPREKNSEWKPVRRS